MSKLAMSSFVLLCLLGTAVYATDRCTYDKDAMLALDVNSFDQDLAGGGGGWRAIANIPGCELAAAELLAAYQAEHPDSGSILAWHEGQVRAAGGQYEQAIPLLESARKPEEQDEFGWNFYVDAVIAFLRNDKPALQKAQQQLIAIAYPEGAGLPPLKGGYVEFQTRPGQPTIRMRWPLNIEEVDALLACFGKSYKEATGSSCRSSNH